MRVAFKNLIVSSLVLAAAMFAGTVVLEQTAYAQIKLDNPAGAQPAAQPTAQQAPKEPPYTEKEVIQLVKKNKKNLQGILPDLTNRGVAFDMSADIKDRLTRAGATPEFISAVQNLGPTARAQMAASTAGKGSQSPEEVQAFRAVQNELDNDRKIQEANDFVAKYPNSSLVTYVYFLAQGASLQKGDLDGVLSYGEKSLAANPDNLNALMLMARFLPQPQALRNEVNPEKKLAEAEADGQKALELVGKLEKMPDETDEAFKLRKGGYLEAIHSGLAMVHLQRAMAGLAGIDQDELAKAETEYKAALENASNPDPQDYFRLGEVLARENKKDEAIQAFTKAGQLASDSPQLKQLVDQQIAKLKGKS